MNHRLRDWFECNEKELVEDCARLQKIVAFNLSQFDHEMFSAFMLGVGELLLGRSLNILLDLEARPSFYLSLQDLALLTVEKRKPGI